MPSEFLSAHAAEPDPAEPLRPDEIDSVSLPKEDSDAFDEPVTGENDDQEPAPR